MIEEALLKSNFNGKDGFVWWIGQVAPKKSWSSGGLMSNPENRENNWGARCKVRIIGYHSFDGNVIADVDLPWAQIMLDPVFGNFSGGIGKSVELQGGETCFGFFLDGDDAQQPVIVGLLYRSEGVKNHWPSGEAAAKEKSSQFKPFTGHPGNIVPPTQRESRAPKDFTQSFTSVFSTTNNISNIAFDSKIGYIDPNTKKPLDFTKIPQIGDKPIFNVSAACLAFEKCADVTIIKPTGCEKNLIGQITQGLQDFIAVTNGLDRYMHVFIDPVLNEIVDIGNSIKKCANQIVGIVRLIINNLRGTIFKCISWLFRQIIAIKVPKPQQKKIIEAFKEIMDKIFCVLDKLPSSVLDFIQGILKDLVQPLNAPFCAVEQLTAGILAELMNNIDKALSVIISGIDWLADGIGSVSGLLNEANSLASQIFSLLECTGLACKTPHIWAAKFGPTEKQEDDWKKIVKNVNILNGISSGIGSISDAIGESSLYAAVNGKLNGIFDDCTKKVTNPTSQSDIIPLSIGNKYPYCIPPIVTIVGDGILASAFPIVNTDGSIFSIEVRSGGMNYTQATVTVVDNSNYGNGATAKAIIENGSITSIYLTDYGYGYCAGNIGIGTTQTNVKSVNITSSKNSIYEGDSFDINVTSQNILDNTSIKYEITGIRNDAIKQYLTGNLFIKDNKSSITIDTFKDIIDDSKVLTFSLSEYDKSVEIFVNKLNKPQLGNQQYYLTSTNSVITEGQSFVIDLITQNINNDTIVPYTITGISGGLLKNQSLTGTFNVLNNQSKININTNQRIIKDNEIFKLTLDNKLSSVSVLIKPTIDSKKPGISSDISGCIESIILVRPGYGYTVGDTITDGQNTYIPNVSPGSGSIVSIQPLTNPVCGFKSAPTLTINTNTGVGAEVLPLMKYYPTYVSVNQNLVNDQATRIGITTVVDCV